MNLYAIQKSKIHDPPFIIKNKFLDNAIIGTTVADHAADHAKDKSLTRKMRFHIVFAKLTGNYSGSQFKGSRFKVKDTYEPAK
ncbi:MAG: hypothetical protein JRD05_03870 [Deltaproteobacteria bacterium]|nr:hypothetical protein [Deltaproteobacteria bacterium]